MVEQKKPKDVLSGLLMGALETAGPPKLFELTFSSFHRSGTREAREQIVEKTLSLIYIGINLSNQWRTVQHSIEPEKTSGESAVLCPSETPFSDAKTKLKLQEMTKKIGWGGSFSGIECHSAVI